MRSGMKVSSLSLARRSSRRARSASVSTKTFPSETTLRFLSVASWSVLSSSFPASNPCQTSFPGFHRRPSCLSWILDGKVGPDTSTGRAYVVGASWARAGSGSNTLNCSPSSKSLSRLVLERIPSQTLRVGLGTIPNWRSSWRWSKVPWL